MEISKNEVWIILSKDRKVVAKGTPRNRELVLISNKKDKKRFLTYSSEKMAISAFTNNFFSQYRLGGDSKYTKDDLEAVKCYLTLIISNELT